MPDTLNETLEMLSYELRKYQAIRKWALAQCGADFTTGDRVRIKDGYAVPERFADGTYHGWWHKRECLAPGALATVREIDFNEYYGYWYATIMLDREWSVNETGDKEWRHWNGPVADTPEGFEPPSAYEQREYPEGRKHTFSFDVKWLERAE